MTKRVGAMTSELGDGWPDAALVQKIKDYLNHPDDPRGVWRGLQFMEKNGIDFALRSGELHAYLTDERSPLEDPSALSLEQERAIVLALREMVRDELGLAPLTDEEKLPWKYEHWFPTPWRPDQLVPKPWRETHHPTLDEIQDLRLKILDNFPDLMRALSAIYRHNLNAESGDVVSDTWIVHRWWDAIGKVRPELDAAGVQNCRNMMFEYLSKHPDD